MDKLQKQSLKTKAHHLKPIILFGNKGLTEALIKETDIALRDHELIKVKLNGEDREEKALFANELTLAVKAEVVQKIGNTLVLFRKNKDKAKK